MSFFNNLFGGSEPDESSKPNIKWADLNSLAQLDDIVTLSHDKPVIIFKHSTRCGISRTVLKRFENDYNLHEEVNAFFLDLLTYREVSNAVSEKFNVIHQSPQLLLIKDGKAIYDASHGDIDAEILADKI